VDAQSTELRKRSHEFISGSVRCHFATGVTRSYAWRIEQLDRMAKLVAENEAALQSAVAFYTFIRKLGRKERPAWWSSRGKMFLDGST
jgi:uncharacterized protein